MIGRIAGDLMTQSTDDLEKAAVVVRYIQGLYPAETGTTEVRFVGEAWQPGQDMVVINFQKREGIGFYKIDGTVSLDGQPLEHAANGFYGEIVDAEAPTTRTLTVETTAGHTYTFEVPPPLPVEVTSVNGQAEGAVVRTDEPLTLDLDGPDWPDSRVRLALLGDFMGTRSWFDVGHFRPTERIEVPGAIFQHSPAPSLNGGDTWLLVERYRVEPSAVDGVGAVQVISAAWDAVPVRLEGEISQHSGISVSGELTTSAGPIRYSVTKPNAFLGRTFASAKKLAVLSAAVRATKLRQERSKEWSWTSTSYATGTTTKHTVIQTETRTFPRFSQDVWEGLAAAVHDGFVGRIRQQTPGADFASIDEVVQSDTYRRLPVVTDSVSVSEVEVGHADSRVLIPTTLGAIAGSISTTFASDRPDAHLARELGADAMLSITLDLEMDWEGALHPRLAFQVSGPPNGYQYGPTVYALGVIEGAGVSVNDVEGAGLDRLRQVMQLDHLFTALDAALAELERAEAAEPVYAAVWALN